MSEWKKCIDGCGAKYQGYACPYCTIVVIGESELPRGILVLSNITHRQWREALQAYHESNKPNKRMVLFGIDPSVEAKVQYIEFPESPSVDRAMGNYVNATIEALG